MGNAQDSQCTELELLEKLIYIQTIDPLLSISGKDNHNLFSQKQSPDGKKSKPQSRSLFLGLGQLGVYRFRTPPYEYVMKYHKIFMMQDPSCTEFTESLEELWKISHKNLAKIHHISVQEETQMCIKNKRITFYVNYYAFTLQQALQKRSSDNLMFTPAEIWYVLSSLAELGSYLEKLKISYGGFQVGNVSLSAEGYVKMYTHQHCHSNKRGIGKLGFWDYLGSSEQENVISKNQGKAKGKTREYLRSGEEEDNDSSDIAGDSDWIEKMREFIKKDIALPPECLKPFLDIQNRLSPYKADVFSLGILIVRLLTDQNPSKYYEVKLSEREQQTLAEGEKDLKEFRGKDRFQHNRSILKGNPTHSPYRSTSSIASFKNYNVKKRKQLKTSMDCKKGIKKQLCFDFNLVRQDIESLTEIYGSELIGIILGMIDTNPESRLNFSEINQTICQLRDDLSMGGCVRMFDDAENPIAPRFQFRHNHNFSNDFAPGNFHFDIETGESQAVQQKRPIFQEIDFNLAVTPIGLLKKDVALLNQEKESSQNNQSEKSERDKPGVSLISKKQIFRAGEIQYFKSALNFNHKFTGKLEGSNGKILGNDSAEQQFQTGCSQRKDCKKGKIFLQLQISDTQEKAIKSMNKVNRNPKNNENSSKYVRRRKLSRLSSPDQFFYGNDNNNSQVKNPFQQKFTSVTLKNASAVQKRRIVDARERQRQIQKSWNGQSLADGIKIVFPR